ncbi:MAG: type II toxin-antitoxin system CcdA family antitoxin [Thermoplasmatales archaeon]|nr:type II toxin-antitoxin system CcdA family antitoxin [Thermoplasmatales archaeon]
MLLFIHLYAFIRMAKKPLNLLVDEDLIKRAREHNLILSKVFEQLLEDYIDKWDAVSKSKGVNGPRGIRTLVTGSEGQ